ncbi:bacteriocin fulvocin C-related protein [Ferruginibacter profundus]
MKTNIFAAFIMVVLISSCTKDLGGKITEQEFSGNQAVINEVVSISSTQAQRVAYGLLVPENKTAIWKQHLENYIQNNENSDLQKNLIKEFISTINPDIFLNKENARTFMAKAEVAELVYKCKRAFSTQEIYNIFGSLKSKTVANTSSVESGNSCSCNTSSDFCSGESKCYAYMWDCSTSNMGCGWLLLESCNGKCGVMPS